MALPDLLHAAGNRFTTTLSAGISDTDLSITLTSTTGLNSEGGALIIDKDNDASREIVYYTSIAGSILTIPSGGRGLAGTSAVAHTLGAAVNDVIISNHIEDIVDEVEGMAESIIETIYPVGAIYISTNSTNPGTLFGFGTWVAFGAGKTLIGFNSGDTDFDTVEETGGAKTHTLTTNEMPSHTHIQDSHNYTQNAHNHETYRTTSKSNGAGLAGGDNIDGYGGGQGTANTTATNQATTATNQNTGGGAAHNNLPPYIVTYFFKRTV